MKLKRRYFTVSEAAAKLGVTRQTVSRWVASGKVKAEKIGRETLIDKLELRKYMRKRWIESLRSEIGKGLLNDFCPERDFFENYSVEIAKASKRFPFTLLFEEPITFEHIPPEGKKEQHLIPIGAITIDRDDNVKWYLQKEWPENRKKSQRK